MLDSTLGTLHVRVLSVLRHRKVEGVADLLRDFEPEEGEPVRRAFMEVLGHGFAIRDELGMYVVATVPTIGPRSTTPSGLRERILGMARNSGSFAAHEVGHYLGSNRAKAAARDVLEELIEEGELIRYGARIYSKDGFYDATRRKTLRQRTSRTVVRSARAGGVIDKDEAGFLAGARVLSDMERMHESMARGASEKAAKVAAEQSLKTLERRVIAILSVEPVSYEAISAALPQSDRETITHTLVRMARQGVIDCSHDATYFVTGKAPVAEAVVTPPPASGLTEEAGEAQTAANLPAATAHPGLEPDLEQDEREAADWFEPPSLAADPAVQRERDIEWEKTDPLATDDPPHLAEEEDSGFVESASEAFGEAQELDDAEPFAVVPAKQPELPASVVESLPPRPAMPRDPEAEERLIRRLAPGVAYELNSLETQFLEFPNLAGAAAGLIVDGRLIELSLDRNRVVLLRFDEFEASAVEDPLDGMSALEVAGSQMCMVLRAFTVERIARGDGYLTRAELAHILEMAFDVWTYDLASEAVERAIADKALRKVTDDEGEDRFGPDAEILLALDLLDQFGQPRHPISDEEVRGGRERARSKAEIVSEDAAPIEIELPTPGAQAETGSTTLIQPARVAIGRKVGKGRLVLDPVEGPRFRDLEKAVLAKKSPLSRAIRDERALRTAIVFAIAEDQKARLITANQGEALRVAFELAAEGQIIAYEDGFFGAPNAARPTINGRTLSALSRELAGDQANRLKTFVRRQIERVEADPVVACLRGAPAIFGVIMRRTGLDREAVAQSVHEARSLNLVVRIERHGGASGHGASVYVHADDAPSFDVTSFIDPVEKLIRSRIRCGRLYLVKDIVESTTASPGDVEGAMRALAAQGHLKRMRDALVVCALSDPLDVQDEFTPASLASLYGPENASLIRALMRTGPSSAQDLVAALSDPVRFKTVESVTEALQALAQRNSAVFAKRDEGGPAIVWSLGAHVEQVAQHLLEDDHSEPEAAPVEEQAPKTATERDEGVLARMTAGEVYSMAALKLGADAANTAANELSALQAEGWIRIERFKSFASLIVCLKTRDTSPREDPLQPVRPSDLMAGVSKEIILHLDGAVGMTAAEIQKDLEAKANDLDFSKFDQELKMLEQRGVIRARKGVDTARYVLADSTQKMIALVAGRTIGEKA